MKRLFVSFALVLAAIPAMANPNNVSLGTPSYGGSGCPAGSAATALSPDASSLSILFDKYIVEAGGQSRRQVARKNCDIAIPVHVPQGYSVSIFKIDYRGFNSLPYGAYSQFNVEYFFAGTQGPQFTKTFRGQLRGEYLLTNTLAAHAVVWSQCGASVILRTNTSMMVQTNRENQDAMSTVDSVDVKSGLIYNLRWRAC